MRGYIESYSWINLISVDDKATLLGEIVERSRSILSLWKKIAIKRFDLCATLYYDRRYRVLTWPVRVTGKAMLSGQSRATTLLPGRHHTDEFARVLLRAEDGCLERSLTPFARIVCHHRCCPTEPRCGALRWFPVESSI